MKEMVQLSTQWWKKPDYEGWAIDSLEKWKKDYSSEVVFGRRSLDNVIRFFCGALHVKEASLVEELGEHFLNDYLYPNTNLKETAFRCFLVTKDDLSHEYYEYHVENEPIWVVFGDNDFIASSSALLECRLKQYRGLSNEDFENNTEAAFWYMANIDALHRVLEES